MSPPDQLREQLFHAAAELPNPAQRAAFLDAACGQNPQLRAEIEDLLRHDDAAGSYLDKPVSPDELTPTPVAERPGAVIGPYKLLEQIGEGGFGVVYMAEQTEPVRRKVALKILKPGMDTRQVVARFEAERQALAIMDHPNIAKVFDGGTTARLQISDFRLQIEAKAAASSNLQSEICNLQSTGRPYFVMELVKGVPITEYCDQNHLTPRQRLELFIPVCQAVQHAHQKGIIHRDLKPSNILVSRHDSTAVPKVIDFGVAKALGQELTANTLFTGFAQMIGTPLYMSPEQAGMSDLDIDTRSDIYSLGVLLYELLTGTTPFDKERLKEAGYDEIRRIIREEEPAKPSTRISTLGQAASTVSTNRQSDPRRLSQLFRGELDWIVMKALEKDRNRRYETANGFAMDVQRYLADEPVLACPPSVGYRFRKFARRNKAALVTAALILVAIAVVAGGVGWIINDRQAKQLMTEREVENAVVEANRLQIQSRWAEALSWVTRAEGVLAHGGGNEDLRRRVQGLRADLEIVAALEEIRLQAEDVKDRQVHIDVDGKDRAYERVFREYGIDVVALDPAEAARRIQARSIHDHLTDALYDWLTCARQKPRIDHLWTVLGLADPDEWRNAFRGAVWRGDVEAQRHLAAQPEFSRLRPYTASFLGRQFHNRRETSKALELFLAVQQRYPDDFWINFTLGWCYRTMTPPRPDQAIRYDTAAVALRPRSPGARLNLGASLSDSGSYDEAIACYRQAIDLNPKCAAAHFNLGCVLTKQGKLDEAIACYRKAIDLDPKGSTEYHANLNLGVARQRQGNVDEAIAWYRKAIDLDPNQSGARNNLGEALRIQGKLDEAIASLRKAIELDPKDVGPHYNLAVALLAQGKLDEAIGEFREAIRQKPRDPKPHDSLGRALMRKGLLDEAIAEIREAIRLSPGYARAHVNLGSALWQKGCRDEALASYKQALRLKKADEWWIHNHLNNQAWDMVTSPDPKARDPLRAVELAKEVVAVAPFGIFWNTLGVAHYRAGSWKEAFAAVQKSMEQRKGGDSFDWFFMAMAHWQLGNKEEARRWYDRAVEWMDKNKPTDEQLRRFRAEAAELLCVEKKKD